MSKKTALIIGGGPAGLTAAYELLEQTDVHPIIVEADTQVGGISKTIHYNGNKIDIGGHRFFSKSSRVMDWWQRMLPPTGDPEKTDRVFLTRSRLSRIYFLRKFFSYPISLSVTTMRYLGLWRLIKIGVSYTKASVFPIKHETSLEDFFINRFGKTLYLIFFKDYTEKVWGEPCHTIDASWGAQRIKGLSIRKAITHALTQWVKKDQSVEQKKTETSLIERFLYPKHGPGQLWEVTAEKIIERGGVIHMQTTATQLHWSENRVTAVTLHHQTTNTTERIPVDYV
ncbi:MAG: FAD-dependent oxidoreductase, partial [Candidatus Marinamargulisbacteria bacterium]|nr:FAD-dependent oxidoreductase [Candidatus Marinamargulisbacteria bacterium]